ncbi:glycosyltransferase [Niabella sp. W65]|nr:glycosyltransferase [Niabella sp. W65]MCH7361446.1 glycosyltransferase [Niabella sp. W65]ULT45248.1 glycosyltransferase [Niabella sp. I65]
MPAEDLGRKLGIFEKMIFVGKQEQIEDVFAIADLFLLPSEYESFGLAALEAMASKVPVISSNAGGLKEVNIDGVTGYTANVGDVKTMSERAIDILKDNATLQKFRQGLLSMHSNTIWTPSFLNTKPFTGGFARTAKKRVRNMGSGE